MDISKIYRNFSYDPVSIQLFDSAKVSVNVLEIKHANFQHHDMKTNQPNSREVFQLHDIQLAAKEVCKILCSIEICVILIVLNTRVN